MAKTLDFYFDFGSPTAYLAHKRLLQLQEQYPLTVNYQPILLGALHKASNNTSPVMVPNKGKYMLMHDLPRFAKRYGAPLKMNSHFPINTLPLMRGCFAAKELNCYEEYVDVMFKAMWEQNLNMADAQVIAQTLDENHLPAESILEMVQQPSIKQQLMDATDKAVKLEMFGAPTMLMDGEMYFGQDRLDFIEEALKN